MAESSLVIRPRSKPKQGTLGNRCSPHSRFGVAARALWPRKTAAELAHLTNVSERAAKFWIRGDRDPSVDALMAVMNEIRGKRRA
jgi:hypothetical protein